MRLLYEPTLTGWPTILCWQGLGNNSQLCSHWAMCAPSLADASLDRRRQNAYKSPCRGRTPVKLGALRRRRRGEGGPLNWPPSAHLVAGNEALRTRGALKTPGARVSGRCASVRGTPRWTRRDSHAIV